MNTKVKQGIIERAIANPQQEICGFIVYGEGFVKDIPCNNTVQQNSAHAFQIDPQDYIRASRIGRVCGVYHSHPTGPAAFSERDIEAALALALPSFVVALSPDKDPQWLSYVPPNYFVPSLGRPWAWGEADCLEAVRVYYRQEKGIYLTDYDRDESFRETQSDAILQHIEAEGFTCVGTDVSSAAIGDVFLFNTDGRKFPHHLGVCVEKSRIYHHPFGRLSCVDDINHHWLRYLKGIYRYSKTA